MINKNYDCKNIILFLEFNEKTNEWIEFPVYADIATTIQNIDRRYYTSFSFSALRCYQLARRLRKTIFFKFEPFLKLVFSFLSNLKKEKKQK